MNAREYLEVAEDSSDGFREGDWRTAISRAYFAAFHVARTLFTHCGFDVPTGEGAHRYLTFRLDNCGHPDAIQAGRDLRELRRTPNRADYDFHLVVTQREAQTAVARADEIITLFEQVAENEPVRERVVQAMREYERDVLKEVTWHEPE